MPHVHVCIPIDTHVAEYSTIYGKVWLDVPCGVCSGAIDSSYDICTSGLDPCRRFTVHVLKAQKLERL